MSESDQFSKESLAAMFVGKRVEVTQLAGPGSTSRPKIGVCRAVHNTGSGVDFELEGGRRYGLVSDKMGSGFVEGQGGLYPRHRRKIRIVE